MPHFTSVLPVLMHESTLFVMPTVSHAMSCCVYCTDVHAKISESTLQPTDSTQLQYMSLFPSTRHSSWRHAWQAAGGAVHLGHRCWQVRDDAASEGPRCTGAPAAPIAVCSRYHRPTLCRRTHQSCPANVCCWRICACRCQHSSHTNSTISGAASRCGLCRRSSSIGGSSIGSSTGSGSGTGSGRGG